MAGSRARVVISDALIIKACNTPGGSGGVYRWADAVTRDVKAKAIRLAPVNKPLDAVHRGGQVGTYKASFKSDRRGSKGHKLRRTIYNDAPHAAVVEKGRRSTINQRWETFSWTVWGGQINRVHGTWGREGQHILERAFLAAINGPRRIFVSASLGPLS